MQVILTDKLRNLGEIGDVVTVKPGYGRNFLIPQGKAQRATKANIEHFESQRAELEKRAKDNLQAAHARAEKLSSAVVTVSARAGDEGKLYGSVGPKEVSDALIAAGFEVEKKEITMPEGPIHEVGEFDVALQLHSDVEAQVKVRVVAE